MTTLMLEEALSAPQAVARLLARDADAYADAGAMLRAQPPRSVLTLGRAVVATDLLRERELVLRRLRRQGIFCVDAAPAAVSIDLLNRYLDIRRRELV